MKQYPSCELPGGTDGLSLSKVAPVTSVAQTRQNRVEGRAVHQSPPAPGKGCVIATGTDCVPEKPRHLPGPRAWSSGGQAQPLPQWARPPTRAGSPAPRAARRPQWAGVRGGRDKPCSGSPSQTLCSSFKGGGLRRQPFVCRETSPSVGPNGCCAPELSRANAGADSCGRSCCCPGSAGVNAGVFLIAWTLAPEAKRQGF